MRIPLNPFKKSANNTIAERIAQTNHVRDFPTLEQFLTPYLSRYEIAAIGKAYRFAEKAHSGQTRRSGEPYITHPLSVAAIVASWQLDAQTVMATLLHDVIEDTEYSKETLAKQFDETTASLVDGVSKLKNLTHQSVAQKQAANLSKMMVAMAKDVRVILIKLADRLHNMRTLSSMPPHKQKVISKETLDIYMLIAKRLGFSALETELEELAFQHLHPFRYSVLKKSITGAHGNRQEVIDEVLSSLKKHLASHKIKATVHGRKKSLYSTYCKMTHKKLSFLEVLDVYGFRVIVRSKSLCYQALGALHSLYKPLPGKFKDYIAIPKNNNYQSLHTALIGPGGIPIEVQIRSQTMDHMAETGVAAHWLYKTNNQYAQNPAYHWLKSLLQLQSNSHQPSEFVEHVKGDLDARHVYVFSPRGEIFSLPRHSSALDFAYAVHTDIGNHAATCRINNKPMPLNSTLSNGDRVEIITDSKVTPKPSWLDQVQTSKARSTIRSHLNGKKQQATTFLGEKLLAQILYSLASKDRATQSWDHFINQTSEKDYQKTLSEIGLGQRSAKKVAEHILLSKDDTFKIPQDYALIHEESETTRDTLTIFGENDVHANLATCCTPIPDDDIIGRIEKNELTVHRTQCRELSQKGRENPLLISVAWADKIDTLFYANLTVIALNQPGVLARLAGSIGQEKINIVSISMAETGDETTALYFTLLVKHVAELEKVMRLIYRAPYAIEVRRRGQCRPNRSEEPVY